MEKEYFEALVRGLEEVVAIEKGEIVPPPERVHRVALPDVKAIRKTTGLKQADFAAVIGASFDLVRSWEQHRRNPSGVALKLLRLIERDPTLINELKSIQTA